MPLRPKSLHQTDQQVEERSLQEALEEARRDEEQANRIARRLLKWRKATTVLGVALAANILAVIPFLAGHSLHKQWESVGKNVLASAMALFLAFVYVGGNYSTFWSYLRNVKKTHKEFGPPMVNTKAEDD
jgi:hypothetical protein